MQVERFVTAADFRHIALEKGERDPERVFRAAVSAFCTLSRPTRNEVIQLDDLALGLFASVSAETRRFAATALCECDPAPPGLVKRLSEEPVETAAPLLVRSRALSDVDLITLIARHGLPHARAIARRDGLNPVVAALIRALLARAESEAAVPEPGNHAALEAVRNQLRGLMRLEAPAPIPAEEEPRDLLPVDPYPALREAALSGEMRRFAAALASALGIAPARARSLVSGVTYSDLMMGLKALALSPEQAFVLTAAAYPAQVIHPAAIRLFHVRYTALADESACEKVEAWRREDAKTPRQRPTLVHSLASVK